MMSAKYLTLKTGSATKRCVAVARVLAMFRAVSAQVPEALRQFVQRLSQPTVHCVSGYRRLCRPLATLGHLGHPAPCRCWVRCDGAATAPACAAPGGLSDSRGIF